MPSLPGMQAEVFFGDLDKPLPDWRAHAQPESDDDEPTADELKAVIGMLGFDPAEFADKEDLSEFGGEGSGIKGHITEHAAVKSFLARSQELASQGGAKATAIYHAAADRIAGAAQRTLGRLQGPMLAAAMKPVDGYVFNNIVAAEAPIHAAPLAIKLAAAGAVKGWFAAKARFGAHAEEGEMDADTAAREVIDAIRATVGEEWLPAWEGHAEAFGGPGSGVRGHKTDPKVDALVRDVNAAKSKSDVPQKERLDLLGRVEVMRPEQQKAVHAALGLPGEAGEDATFHALNAHLKSTGSGNLPHPDSPEAAEHLGKALDKVDSAKGGHNFVHLGDLRDATPGWNKDQFDRALKTARRSNTITLSPAEGRHGVTERDKSSAVYEPRTTGSGDDMFLYASRRKP